MKRELFRLDSKGRGSGEGRLLWLGLVALATLCVLVALIWLGARLIKAHHLSRRGVVYGAPPDVPLAAVNPFGVNVSLEQYAGERELARALDLVEEGGFHWVRQRFPWAEIEPEPGEYRWERWDRVVEACTGRDLAIIAVLDTSPQWARTPQNAHNPYAPPQVMDWYGDFVAQFAARFKGRIRYLQLWDEPNIHPHWGAGDVDATGFTELLKIGSLAAREANPQVAILAGGLAPNIEPGGANMSDLLFLEGMYEAGAGPYFDVLAVKPYGLWFEPNDRRTEAQLANFSRPILLRETMERHGGGSKALWAVEFGWNSLPKEWKGQPSLWGQVSEEEQARYTAEAMQRARQEWPWMGVMALTHLQPAVSADDPRWGFALVGPEGSPRLAYWVVKGLAGAEPVAYPGRYSADAWCVRQEGQWHMRRGNLVSTAPGDSLSLHFWGTGLEIELEGESDLAGLLVELDGRPSKLPVRGLALGVYQLKLVAQSGAGVEVSGFTVARELSLVRYYLYLVGLGAGMGIALRLLLESLSRLPVAQWWGWARERYLSWPIWGQMGQVAGAAGLMTFSPWLPLAAFGLAALLVVLFWRLELGLVLLTFSIPFFLHTRALGLRPFHLLELLTLFSFLIWMVRLWRLGSLHGVIDKRFWGKLRTRLSGLDSGMLFFLFVATGSLAVSQNPAVSLREWRVVVVAPVLFYLVVRSLNLRREDIFRLVDALVLAGLVLAGYGLYQYLGGVGTIATEGVRRVRSFYLSPNNLSLFLGRIVPVLVAVVAFGVGKGRRLFYGLALLPVTLCLYLTFSRGAWLVGVPAALLFLGAMRGPRTLALMAGLIALGFLSLLPTTGAQRVATLFDFSQGTGFLRMRLWEASWNMIRDHPFAGVGLDNFLYQYPRYILPGAECEPNLSHPHNIVLDYWTRLGVEGWWRWCSCR